jgi:hypothetical protein
MKYANIPYYSIYQRMKGIDSKMPDQESGEKIEKAAGIQKKSQTRCRGYISTIPSKTNHLHGIFRLNI